MKLLAILGAGGHGRVVADAADCGGQWDQIDFFDDAWKKSNPRIPWPIVGDGSALHASLGRYDGVVVAIGDGPKRIEKCDFIVQNGGALATIIHPAAQVSRYTSIGAGCVILANAVVNINATLGIGCIINTGAIVEHDCFLGKGVHVGTGAKLAGDVEIGDGSWIGVGACVRQQIKIGRYVTVGAGAAVVDTVADSLIVIGVPAKPMRNRNR